MSSPEFREYVLENISDHAKFEGGFGFYLEQSYEDFLASSRSILAILGRGLGQEYVASYDFNTKKARFQPADFS